MKERITAIALLVTFLLGLVLGLVSLSMGNNVLSGFALFFILAGAVGTFAMRRSQQQQENAAKEEQQAENEGFDEAFEDSEDAHSETNLKSTENDSEE